jgi:hypothetical protein
VRDEFLIIPFDHSVRISMAFLFFALAFILTGEPEDLITSKNYCKLAEEFTNLLKGTVSGDFSLLVFL